MSDNQFVPNIAKQKIDALRGTSGLKLPKVVKTELDKIGKLEMLLLQLKRDKPSRAALVDGIIANLAVDDDALAADALHPARIAAVEEAVEVQTGAAMAVVQAHGLAILDEIRATLWTPAMDRVEALSAKIAPDDDPTSLMRAGRDDVAAEWITAEKSLDDMAAALRLSETLFGRPVATGNNAFHSDQLHQFARPDIAAKVWNGNKPLQSMVAAIQAGAGPRLVSAMQADAEHAAYVQAARAQHEEDMRGCLPPFPMN